MHIKGGFFTYKYLGIGIVDPSKSRFDITLTVYMDTAAGGPGQINNPIDFGFYDAATNNFIETVSVPISNDYILSKLHDEPCITGNQARKYYRIIEYKLSNKELSPNSNGYIICYQRCCRINSIENITNGAFVGTSYMIQIPGTNIGLNAFKNSSSRFDVNDTIVVCANNPFSYSFLATDPDNDSLSYHFCDAWDGGSQSNTTPFPPAPPPYTVVPYTSPFNGSQPLGSSVTINPLTGLVSGIAPSITASGEYVLTVCIDEFRSGVLIASNRKELHVKVEPCTPLIAGSNFNAITCDGFTVNFQDGSSGNPTTYLWHFGDPASGVLDTSTSPSPFHTYTDTGIYLVKLVISVNNNCLDSITKPLAVYPGFLPGFITSPAHCVGVPVQFNDTTYSRYALVNSWHWYFGDPTSGVLDTSTYQNPMHTYNLPGTYDVKLVVTNAKGCKDSVTRQVTIYDNPVVSLFPHDTTYCKLDSIQLTATGTGNFTWTPLTFITGGNTATPLVYPPVPTKYIVTLTSLQGCKDKDSVNINPLNDLTNAIAANPPNICEEDTLTLTGTSNHNGNVSWQWSPVATLGTPNQSITIAYPVVNTTYTLTTIWGNNCRAVKSVNIMVKALAHPNAGPDAFVCSGGQSSTQLNASGGDSYQWTPVAGLSNPSIPNPVASPLVPTNYVVAVGVNGCPKLRTDTVFVNAGALPPLTLMNDTLICTIDTLAITTTGTGNFLWSPNYMISSITAPSPLVSPDVPTWYYVQLSDNVGCHTDDSVFIDVRDHVTLLPLRDTSICKTDTIYMRTVSDGLHFLWTPPLDIFTDTSKRPYMIPSVSRVYTVTANIGKCFNTRTITIKVVPYPTANAGPDTSICFGFSAQLNASGGSIYVWNPITFLTDRFAQNPRCINPFANIRYTVTVRDTLGCPKGVTDTVWVHVYPKVVVGASPKDTSVVDNQPLQITVSTPASYSYTWTPSMWLNNSNIGNPIAMPKGDIQYQVVATSPAGCIGLDIVNIHYFKLDPDMYVPNAFTPNGDGVNDIFKPILIGMKQLNYFKVFNRFGEMVFSTTEIDKGWDGKYKGKGQDPATYVWYAQGVTYKGQVRNKKGSVILIR